MNARRKLLSCVLFVGVDKIPLPGTKIHFLDQIFSFEEEQILAARSQDSAFFQRCDVENILSTVNTVKIMKKRSVRSVVVTYAERKITQIK